MEKRVERRKHLRFKVKKELFTALQPGFINSGQIKDIGQGGLAFNYVSAEERDDKASVMDIIPVNGKLYLKDVPFRSVYDTDEKIPSTGVIPWRRRGFEFGELTPAQRNTLNAILEIYSNGEHQSFEKPE